jgi:hypothetical protein
MKIHKISHKGRNFEYWYDSSQRSWYTYPVDENGYQAGDTFNAYTKGEILEAINKDYV